MELEDTYGITVCEEEAARDRDGRRRRRLRPRAAARLTRWRVGSAGSARGRAPAPPPGPSALRELLDALPLTLRRQALTHSSWVEHRADSYGRLAFLGDSVLGLAVAEHLFRRFPRADIGRLTKIHGQAVSGRACAEVADALGRARSCCARRRRERDRGRDRRRRAARLRARAGLGVRGA